MTAFDIIVLLILALALFQGYRRGIVLEVMGLASIIISGYAAYYLATWVAEKFNWSFDYSTELAFVAVFIAFMVTIVGIARIITKLLNVVGLGIVNQIGGAAISVLKYLVIISIFFSLFTALNSKVEIISKSTINRSVTYEPIEKLSETMFPYFNEVKKGVKKITDEYFD